MRSRRGHRRALEALRVSNALLYRPTRRYDGCLSRRHDEQLMFPARSPGGDGQEAELTASAMITVSAPVRGSTCASGRVRVTTSRHTALSRLPGSVKAELRRRRQSCHHRVATPPPQRATPRSAGRCDARSACRRRAGGRPVCQRRQSAAADRPRGSSCADGLAAIAALGCEAGRRPTRTGSAEGRAGTMADDRGAGTGAGSRSSGSRSAGGSAASPSSSRRGGESRPVSRSYDDRLTDDVMPW
jgi:hypothetical protein